MQSYLLPSHHCEQSYATEINTSTYSTVRFRVRFD